MRTLYLRNVPEDVVERLERLAGRDGMSVSALAVRELAESSRRADNADILSGLPSRRGSPREVLDALDAGRTERDAGLDAALDARDPAET